MEKLNLEALTKAELFEECKKLDIPISSKATKPVIIEALENNKSNAEKKSPKADKSEGDFLDDIMNSLDDMATELESNQKTEAEKLEAANIILNEDKSNLLQKISKKKPKKAKPKKESKTDAKKTSQDSSATKKQPKATKAPERQIKSNVHMKGKEKLYRESKHKILTIDADSTEALSENEKAERELLLSLSDPSAMLTGTVVRVSKPSMFKLLDGTLKPIVSLYVRYQNKTIKILSPQFFDQWEKLDDSETLFNASSSRLLSEVDFRVTEISENGDEKMYFGSRVDALAKKREKFWYGKKRGASNSAVYRINEGDIVEARVVALKQTAVVTEVFGTEIAIPLSELEYRFITDARPLYSVGDKINIKITAIKRDSTPSSIEGTKEKAPAYHIAAKASVKQTGPDPRTKYYDDYEVNQTCIGTVTKFLNDNTAPTYIVNVSNEIDVKCWMKKGITFLPIEGDKVAIVLARKYDKKKQFTGTITHVYAQKQKTR